MSAAALPEPGSRMFSNSSAVDVSDSTMTAVGRDTHTTSFNTPAEAVQAAVNSVGRDQIIYTGANIVSEGNTFTLTARRGTATGIMTNGRGGRVLLGHGNTFTIIAAQPEGIVDNGDSNLIQLEQGNTFTLTATDTGRQG
ncbi:hypothetical protein FPV67DRAFT_1673442 [Lyophyllum atratum]|nr:hypothetical protein FPV67DRAFT_1673442 [Lyophyllum atratum]